MTDLHNYSMPKAPIAIDLAKKSRDVVIAWPSDKTLTMKISSTPGALTIKYISTIMLQFIDFIFVEQLRADYYGKINRLV